MKQLTYELKNFVGINYEKFSITINQNFVWFRNKRYLTSDCYPEKLNLFFERFFNFFSNFDSIIWFSDTIFLSIPIFLAITINIFKFVNSKVNS